MRLSAGNDALGVGDGGCIRIGVGVAYDSDPGLVRETLLEVARGHAEVLAEPAPLVFFREFGENALAFELTAWIASVRVAKV